MILTRSVVCVGGDGELMVDILAILDALSRQAERSIP